MTYEAATDAEALDAFQSLCRLEGIIPALETATHGENRYDPAAHDFGDEQSAGDAGALPGEPDEIDVTETVRDPHGGPDDPGEGPGISHDR